MSERILRVLLCIWAGSVLTAGRAPAAQRAQAGAQVNGQPALIEPQPLITLGTVEGNPIDEFFRVRSPFLLPSGRVVVPLAGHGEIRVFTLQGNLVATYGGPGEGPGEFRELDGAWPRGDTIEAFDSELNRITRFHPDGTVSVVRLNVPSDRPTPGFAGSLEGRPGVLLDGWALTAVTATGTNRRDEISVYHVSNDGTLLGVIARVQGLHRHRAPGMIGPTPMSPRAQIATGGGRLYVAETLTPRIRVHDAQGHVMNEIAWNPPPGPTPSAALQDVILLAVEAAPPDARRRVRERLEAASVPERVPTFSAFLVDNHDFVWVRQYEYRRDASALGGPLSSTISGPGGSWWIFTSTGRRVGSIDVPRGFEPYQITTNAVVGIRRDENGVEYVQVHRLQRR